MSTSTSTSFPGVATSVTDARHFVSSSLEGMCPRATVETAALLVSELASNAVRHAGSSTFSVGMTQHGHSVTVAVADDSVALPSVREPDVDGGRGLRIVEALADEWGVRTRPPGKTVFFRLAC